MVFRGTGNLSIHETSWLAIFEFKSKQRNTVNKQIYFNKQIRIFFPFFVYFCHISSNFESLMTFYSNFFPSTKVFQPNIHYFEFFNAIFKNWRLHLLFYDIVTQSQPHHRTHNYFYAEIHQFAKNRISKNKKKKKKIHEFDFSTFMSKFVIICTKGSSKFVDVQTKNLKSAFSQYLHIVILLFYFINTFSVYVYSHV